MVILLITKRQRRWIQYRTLLQIILCSHLKNVGKYLCPHCIQIRQPQPRNTHGNRKNGTFLANGENRFIQGHTWVSGDVTLFCSVPTQINDNTYR